MNNSRFTWEDVQRYYDSIPPGDCEYGLTHRDYPETIYRYVYEGIGFIEAYASPVGEGIASVCVSVHPLWRRRGIASRLVDMLKADMTNLCLTRLEWYCLRKNIPSILCSKKCGFVYEPELSNGEWCVFSWLKQPPPKT